MSTIRWWTAVLLLGGAIACGENGTQNRCDAAPSLAGDIHPNIIVTHCSGCHDSQRVGAARRGAPAGLDFESLPLDLSQRTAVADAITSGRQPPPSSGEPSVSDEARARVTLWRDCGFPD